MRRRGRERLEDGVIAAVMRCRERRAVARSKETTSKDMMLGERIIEMVMRSDGLCGVLLLML